MREKEILPILAERLGIKEPNAMQKKMMEVCTSHHDIILLSPTGSGKTLAFIMPVLKLLKAPSSGRIQCVVIAPGRELVIQTAAVFRQMAPGYKVTSLYGGHSVEEETKSLSVVPDIVVATPGRLLDHAVRGNLDLSPVRIAVLDEFDKSLELGFAEEMSKIFKRLKNVSYTYLISATDISDLPDFVQLHDPLRLDFSGRKESKPRLMVYRVDSIENDKLASLRELLCHLSENGHIGRTIIFVNHRESAVRTFNWLSRNNVACGIYHGALDQMDREKAIEMFNNGSTPVLVATDLAARGLDIEQVENIIHYHLPLTVEAYTHRNGRTARADASGRVFILLGPSEDLPSFITVERTMWPDNKECDSIVADTATLYIGAGKKDKISRGDILGFLLKQCALLSSEVGHILVADRYSFVAVPTDKVNEICRRAREEKLKGRKLKIAPATVADTSMTLTDMRTKKRR